MFDNAQRSIWLEQQLWPKLRDAFPALKVAFPAEVLITVGYPSSGARGRSEKIKPAEVSRQWQGNPNEKLWIAVHPVYFDSTLNIAKAALFGLGKAISARWGPNEFGLHKRDDGEIEATPATTAKLGEIIADIGDPPAGYGVPFPVRNVQRARLRRYATVKACDKDKPHPIIRAASDTLQVECQKCGEKYKLT